MERSGAHGQERKRQVAGQFYFKDTRSVNSRKIHIKHSHTTHSGIPADTETPAPLTTNIFLYLPSFNDSTIDSNVTLSGEVDVELSLLLLL